MRAATLLARVTNATALTQRLQRRLGTRHARVYLSSDGRRIGRWFGAPVLVLETIGRRTGERRRTPVIYLEDEAGLVVVAANGGADRVPAWWRNLEAAGHGAIVVQGRRRAVAPRVAAGPERERLWHAFAAMYPSLDDYRRLTDRELPVVVLEPREELGGVGGAGFEPA
jgi:F420H(2)-dependent quinone reductase